MNTGQDESDATFRLAKKPPLAKIMSPETEVHLLLEQNVILAGEAYDPEDGMLPDSAFTWLLDDHLIGTGSPISATGLPLGWHELTLRVVDSNG